MKMFVDENVICGESREQVEGRWERWLCAQGRRRVDVSEMCVCGREGI